MTDANAAPPEPLGECGACDDGWANTEDHECELGANGGWGSKSDYGTTLDDAILNELRKDPETMYRALQQSFDEQLRAATERAARLEAEVKEQWWENHFEHCGRTWPHADGEFCGWPLPPVLKDPA